MAIVSMGIYGGARLDFGLSHTAYWALVRLGLVQLGRSRALVLRVVVHWDPGSADVSPPGSLVQKTRNPSERPILPGSVHGESLSALRLHRDPHIFRFMESAFCLISALNRKLLHSNYIIDLLCRRL